MPMLVQPLPAETLAWWRATVLELRTDVRRVFAPLLHAGTPGGRNFTAPVRFEGEVDQGLQVDLARVLIERARGAGAFSALWLTRSGSLDLHDLDAMWCAASVRACREAGVDDTFVVVTRPGWRDPRSGVERTWKRLRPSVGTGAPSGSAAPSTADV